RREVKAPRRQDLAVPDSADTLWAARSATMMKGWRRKADGHQEIAMWLRGHLRTRRRQPEIMDEADLDPRAHAQALRGLERINLWSGSARILWPPLRHLAGATSGRPLRILDIATGAGDVPIRLWHRAQRAGLAVELAGCDRSPMAVAYARQRAAEKKAAVAFFEYDALRDPLPGGH